MLIILVRARYIETRNTRACGSSIFPWGNPAFLLRASMAEIDEEKFLQRSDVLGAEFVRLFLGDGAAGVPLGPGSGSESGEKKKEKEGEGQAASEVSQEQAVS